MHAGPPNQAVPTMLELVPRGVNKWVGAQVCVLTDPCEGSCCDLAASPLSTGIAEEPRDLKGGVHGLRRWQQ